MDIRVRKNGCWANRTRVEQVLIAVIIIALVIALILTIVVVTKQKNVAEPEDKCKSLTCLDAAAQISQQIDPSVNPCEDFYHFACGNFLKLAQGDENLNLLNQMQSQYKRKLLELYLADIQKDEHTMVKKMKKLFHKCLMENADKENENIRSVKRMVKELGGWPVVEGPNWIDLKFDWLKATYKLRHAGYPFNMFLDVSVDKDPQAPNKHILKVKPPSHVNDVLMKYPQIEAVQFMTEVAMLFGARDKSFTSKQMDGTYRFWKYLHSMYTGGAPYKRTTVEDFNEKFSKLESSFDWLQFLNIIVGPKVTILNNESVLFENEGTLAKWIHILNTTPKRTLANYMMWSIIEKQLPYMSQRLLTLDINVDLGMNIPRSEICLREINDRFVPNPMKIMYDRKNLPLDRRSRVEDILFHIKDAFMGAIKQASWLGKSDKEITTEKADNLEIIVGHPGDFFNDNILDDLNVDMVDPVDSSFLSAMAQVNRNYQSIKYSNLNSSTLKSFTHDQTYFNNFATYDASTNMIFVPTIATEGYAFHESWPGYLNYKILGNVFTDFLESFVSSPYSEVQKTWTNESKSQKLNINCVTQSTEECFGDPSEAILASRELFARKISYAAYKKTVEEDKALTGLPYTPNQLFWIASTYCHSTNVYSTGYSKDLDLFPHFICGARRSDANFATDFNCPAGSKMNPSNTCN